MYTVRLTPGVEQKLKDLLSRGKSLTRVTKKARILQLVALGNSAKGAAKAVGKSPTTARTVCRFFSLGDLKHALYDLPIPGHAWPTTSQQEVKILAMVCSSAPQGLAARSISIIPKEAVGRKIVKRASRSTIGLFCIATPSSRGWKKMWCVPKITATYLQRMKDIRDLYELFVDRPEPDLPGNGEARTSPGCSTISQNPIEA